jgi:hypothetical protein
MTSLHPQSSDSQIYENTDGEGTCLHFITDREQQLTIFHFEKMPLTFEIMVSNFRHFDHVVVFWVLIPCSDVVGNKHFRGIFCLHENSEDHNLNLHYHESLRSLF